MRISLVRISWREVIAIALVAVLFLSGSEVLLRAFQVPHYVLPTPSAVFETLIKDFPVLYWPHLLVTLKEFALGFIIGAGIGLVLAGIITQFPFVEKIITPYIILGVTTPMIALVPLLMLKLGFGIAPRVIAVALAAGPMMMINAATGFRRVEREKIALARIYQASTWQIFLKVRFPMALPNIMVGLLVGAIFGLLTAVAAEMVGGTMGLGNRLVYFTTLLRMAQFFATIFLVALMGIGIYVFFYLLGKKLCSWGDY